MLAILSNPASESGLPFSLPNDDAQIKEIFKNYDAVLRRVRMNKEGISSLLVDHIIMKNYNLNRHSQFAIDTHSHYLGYIIALLKAAKEEFPEDYKKAKEILKKNNL